MAGIVGAILILASSVLVGAAIIAHSTVMPSTTLHAVVGYFLGGLLAVIGFAVLLAGPLKRVWDAIPVDDKKPKTDD